MRLEQRGSHQVAGTKHIVSPFCFWYLHKDLNQALGTETIQYYGALRNAIGQPTDVPPPEHDVIPAVSRSPQTTPILEDPTASILATLFAMTSRSL